MFSSSIAAKQGARPGVPTRSIANPIARLTRWHAGLGENAQALFFVLCIAVGMLLVASLAVVVITGQFPWFLLALAAVLFFGSCLPWKRELRKDD